MAKIVVAALVILVVNDADFQLISLKSPVSYLKQANSYVFQLLILVKDG